MENPAPFHLNDAIRRWRLEFEASGTVSDEETEELETHLRDAIMTATARGVPVEEAFYLAVAQTGAASNLAPEFIKAFPQRIWYSRAFWMISGVLLANLPIYLGALVFIALLYPLLAFTNQAAFAVAASFLGSLLTKALVLFLIWKTGSVCQSDKPIRLIANCLRRPLAPFLVLSVLLFAIQPVFRLIHAAITPADIRPVPLGTSLMQWTFILEHLCWLALPFWLAGLRANRRVSPESRIVSTRWQDCCLWMTAGLAFKMAIGLLMEPFGRIAYAVADFFAHNISISTMAWGLAIFLGHVAIVTTAALFIHRKQEYFKRASRWIACYPFAGFALTVVLLASAYCGVSATVVAITEAPRLSGAIEIWNISLTHLGFLVALFWLGQRVYPGHRNQSPAVFTT